MGRTELVAVMAAIIYGARTGTQGISNPDTRAFDAIAREAWELYYAVHRAATGEPGWSVAGAERSEEA